VILGASSVVTGGPPEGTWGRAVLPGPWLRLGIGAVLIVVAIVCFRVARRSDRRNPRTFLSREEESQVIHAIAEFERKTSGEIRVHLISRRRGDLTDAAVKLFEKQGMTRTAARNGVLFCIDVRARELAVIGDTGIHAAVGKEFWERTVSRVRDAFREGAHARGLIDGIGLVGSALAEHFPPSPRDVNELPDDISREE
jgi:uncharacterized membrane protein